MRGVNSIMETLVPSPLMIVPSSTPTTPPPTIIRLAGMCLSSRTSLEYRMSVPWKPGNSSRHGTDPEATIIWRAFKVSVIPSFWMIFKLFKSRRLAEPEMTDTPLCCSVCRSPPFIKETILFLYSRNPARLIFAGPASIPKEDALLIERNNSSEWSRVLVGMQARFRQAPPGMFFSMRMTEAPSLEARTAALYPAGPPPTTATSAVNSGIKIT